MKTEKFDEEFRRKLLGLPAEADPGEVERIQGFVNANKPALPGSGWGKLLLYGGSSLLLIGSLSYNLLQNYRNTHLQSSIDSLTHRSVVQTMPNPVIRHDTVYITRSDNTETLAAESEPGIVPETVRNGPVKQADQAKFDATRRNGSVATRNAQLAQSDSEASLLQPEAGFSRSASRSNAPSVAMADPIASMKRTEKSGQIHTETDSLLTTLPITSSDRLLTEKATPVTETERINKRTNTDKKRVEGYYPNANLSAVTRSKMRRGKKGQQTIPSSGTNSLLATNQSGKPKQRTIGSPPTAGFTSIHTENTNSDASISEVNRQPITAEPLASRQTRTAKNQLAIISPSRPLGVPGNELSGKVTHRSWHLKMPSLSVPNAQYRIGAGLTGGSDQVGGALLGEIMLNRHWSVQTGLQVGYIQGFHYRDEQDFNEHQHEDFRQTYAPQLSSSSDIQDIRQMTLLVQVPIQIAYHYALGRQWGLRLGFGTDLNLWGRSAVNFDYRENSRSSEHELSRSKEHVHTINNLILNTAIERSWRKWFFRAGPFISPQLRSTDYKRDDLFWGANVQVLYRLGK